MNTFVARLIGVADPTQIKVWHYISLFTAPWPNCPGFVVKMLPSLHEIELNVVLFSSQDWNKILKVEMLRLSFLVCSWCPIPTVPYWAIVLWFPYRIFDRLCANKENFTLELEGPWLLKSKFIHWWKVLSHSLYIRAVGPKWPRKFKWLKNLLGVLHGIQWTMYHGLMNLCSSCLKEVGLVQIRKTISFQNLTALDLGYCVEGSYD